VVDVHLLHFEQQFLIVRNTLNQSPNALHRLRCLGLVLGVLLVSLVKCIQQHAEELARLHAQIIIDVDVGVHQKFDLRDCGPVFQLLNSIDRTIMLAFIAFICDLSSPRITSYLASNF
jgi:hypothetical protein